MAVSETAASRYPKARSAWWSITALFVASVVSIVDRGILNVVVDPVRHDLGLSDVQIGLLQGLAFGLFYALVGIPLGLLADRTSRRRLIAAGALVWSLATVGGGFAQSFGELFGARLLVGLGEAALGPAAISLIADLFPPDRRGRPLSIYLAGNAISNGLAISITSFLVTAAAQGRFDGFPLLADAAPWRVAFIGCGFLGLVVAVLMLTTTEPTRKANPGGAAATPGLADKLAFLRGKAALLVPLYLGFAICFMAAYGAAAWTPTMLLRSFKLTPAALGTWLGPFSMAFSIAGPLIGGALIDAFARRSLHGAKYIMLIVAPLVAIPSGLAIFAPSPGVAMLLVAWSSGVFPIVGTTVFAMFQTIMPSDMRGTSIAMAGLLNTLLGAALGPVLVASITQTDKADPMMVGYSIALVTIPALLLASALFALARRAALRLGV
jgi:MFS family permease